MEKRHQNSLWNRLELIGINTCKYGIEYEGQKTTSSTAVRSRIFGIKRNPAVRAPRICLSEEEVIRIMRNEDAIKKKIGNLIDSMLCDDSQISEMDNTKNKTEAFDIDEFV